MTKRTEITIETRSVTIIRTIGRLLWSHSSADGMKLVAVVENRQIFTSTDFGMTWNARESTRNWFSVASSAHLTQFVTGVDGGQVFTSTDSGLTWTARESCRAWQAVAISADSTRMIAAAFGEQIYVGSGAIRTPLHCRLSIWVTTECFRASLAGSDRALCRAYRARGSALDE